MGWGGGGGVREGVDGELRGTRHRCCHLVSREGRSSRRGGKEEEVVVEPGRRWGLGHVRRGGLARARPGLARWRVIAVLLFITVAGRHDLGGVVLIAVLGLLGR